jgi:hypothetical protein
MITVGAAVSLQSGLLPPLFTRTPSELPVEFRNLSTDELRILLTGNSLSNFGNGKIQFFSALHFQKNGTGNGPVDLFQDPFKYLIFNKHYCIKYKIRSYYWKCYKIYEKKGLYYQYEQKIGFYRIVIKINDTGDVR